MAALAHRSWVSEACETFVQAIAEDTARATSTAIDASIERLIVANTKIHDVDCINLNPATNVLNPRDRQADTASKQVCGSQTFGSSLPAAVSRRFDRKLVRGGRDALWAEDRNALGHQSDCQRVCRFDHRCRIPSAMFPPVEQ